MPHGKHCLGLHIGHDRGAAIVRDGELIAAVAEERLDRRKHSSSPELPLLSINAVLKTARISASDLAGIAVSYTNISIEKIIHQLSEEIRDALALTGDVPILGASHHECHALSTYFTSGASRALVLVADGAGDMVDDFLEAESLYLAEDGKLTLLERRLQNIGLARADRRNSFSMAYMHPIDRQKQISLGRKYEQFTYLVGFEHGESGKTMGLAACAAEPLLRLPPPQVDGLRFDLTFESGLAELDQQWKRSGEPWHLFIRRNAEAIAATAQSMLEDHMIAIARSINPDGRYDLLCAAGGVFLNCKMNHALLKASEFERLHVFPAAGDDGQSVGAAFHAYQQCIGAPISRSLRDAYLGPVQDADRIAERIHYFGLTAKRLDEEWLAARLAKDLAAGKIVALLRGRSEIGPRALCHRSILADPRQKGMKNCLNYVKGRELFRPFAPVIASEDQDTYFELEQDSPFMLLACQLREQYQEALPAIVHADGTSRVQSLSADQDAFVHTLLKAFEKLTGHPVLLNTSFNLSGDPIVESPHDAIVSFLASDIDVLVIEDFYICDKTSRAGVRKSG